MKALDMSMASSRKPSWLLEQNQAEESESYKIESKLCADLGAALKFWDNKCIVDAYFN